MTRLLICTLLILAGARASLGDDPVQRRIDERFANAAGASTERPGFRQHVVPLMGKLGCNGRACHGSFQGQGGFQLSLFGYDFPADHANLMAADEQRVTTAVPASSLILTKPTLQVEHEGGQLFHADEWPYRVLQRWIETGAAGVDATTPELVELDVSPREFVANQAGATQQLQVIARWSDGSREDVTPLCRFQSNNDQLAAVSEHGLMTAREAGDTHVVVFYDNGVVPIPVMLPVATPIVRGETDSKETGAADSSNPSRQLDRLVQAKLDRLGVEPSPRCSDEEFLRRVSLDLTGSLPTAAEVVAFLDDHGADKRLRKVDELLARPTYAAWWATRFSDVTGNNSRYLNQYSLGAEQASSEWYEWIRQRIEQNVPYDELVEGIVTATSRLPEETYDAYCARMSACYGNESEQTYADQPSLTHYWMRTNVRQPQERALAFAHAFLGVRIQCAECHKHPFDQWTKDDFDRFKTFFGRLNYGVAPDGRPIQNQMTADLGLDGKKLNNNQLAKLNRELIGEGKVVPFKELFVPDAASTIRRMRAANKPGGNKKRPQLIVGRTAKFLGGDEVPVDELPDPRAALMDWLRDDHNPYFARAFVNRVWANYFNVGIIEPPDDLSLANPPSNEPLLEFLATEFRRQHYDMKWLHRTIAASETYQRGWETNSTNRLDERNFSRSVPRRLPAEVFYDALQQTTADDAMAVSLASDPSGRAIGGGAPGRKEPKSRSGYALAVFGRSIRESNCDCDRSSDPSLLQAIYLQNDAEVTALINRADGWLRQAVQQIQQRDSNSVGENQAASEFVTAEQVEERIARLEKQLAQARKNDVPKRIARVERLLADQQRALEQMQSTTSESSPRGPLFHLDAAATQRLNTAIEQLYLRSVSRRPTFAEQWQVREHVLGSTDLATGLRDAVWALVNSKEFVSNH